MSIRFGEIYQKSIALFDDPKITAAYETNKIQFYKLMYTFLQNSITAFNNPSAISIELSNYAEPEGIMDVIESDGESTTYNLDPGFIIRPNSIYHFTADGEDVEGTINPSTHKVTFPNVIPVGFEYTVEQYYEGEFLSDFSDVGAVSSNGDTFVVSAIKDILARLLVVSWAEGERNNVLDIRNVLSESDFKNSPHDKILKSKNLWIDQLNSEADRLKNRLAWIITFMGNSNKIGRL